MDGRSFFRRFRPSSSCFNSRLSIPRYHSSTWQDSDSLVFDMPVNIIRPAATVSAPLLRSLPRNRLHASAAPALKPAQLQILFSLEAQNCSDLQGSQRLEV